MKLVPKKAYVLARKVLPDISPDFADFYHLPDDHRSAGFFSCTNDDVAFVAADDATKKANITVRLASTYYGGMNGSWSNNGGAIFVLMSGPRVEDVRSGLRYASDFIENQCALANFDSIPAFGFYAQCVPRVGHYYSELLGIPENSAYAYLLGPPAEANVALDLAIKAGDVTLVKYWYPPAKVNSSGGIIYGSEPACQAATQAFIRGLHDAFLTPIDPL